MLTPNKRGTLVVTLCSYVDSVGSNHNGTSLKFRYVELEYCVACSDPDKMKKWIVRFISTCKTTIYRGTNTIFPVLTKPKYVLTLSLSYPVYPCLEK